MAKILSDFGGAANSILVYIGDKLGLYKAMSDFGKPITSQELASLTETSERYIREWLANQAAGGYLIYDPSSQKYTLPFEHAQVLANENSPVYASGGFQVMISLYRDEAKILGAFKTGKGIAWGDHDKDLFVALSATPAAVSTNFGTSLVTKPDDNDANGTTKFSANRNVYKLEKYNKQAGESRGQSSRRTIHVLPSNWYNSELY